MENVAERLEGFLAKVEWKYPVSEEYGRGFNNGIEMALSMIENRPVHYITKLENYRGKDEVNSIVQG